MLLYLEQLRHLDLGFVHASNALSCATVSSRRKSYIMKTFILTFVFLAVLATTKSPSKLLSFQLFQKQNLVNLLDQQPNTTGKVEQVVAING